MGAEMAARCACGPVHGHRWLSAGLTDGLIGGAWNEMLRAVTQPSFAPPPTAWRSVDLHDLQPPNAQYTLWPSNIRKPSCNQRVECHAWRARYPTRRAANIGFVSTTKQMMAVERRSRYGGNTAINKRLNQNHHPRIVTGQGTWQEMPRASVADEELYRSAREGWPVGDWRQAAEVA